MAIFDSPHPVPANNYLEPLSFIKAKRALLFLHNKMKFRHVQRLTEPL